ncbi:MAG: sulfur carrier protein ThiS [Mariprofundus sp.]|nr:sulfur carrier protein ThiS [Mariprofundus sp.]
MSEALMIHLNGEEYSTKARSLTELVRELALEERMIAMERNLEVVPKSQYASTLLKNSDRIELVHMIGGG